METVAAELEATLDAAEERLLAIEDGAGTGTWSRKEILGHLIDSAANNHQRFVRLQIESSIALPSYQQPDWVRVQRYAERLWGELVALWLAYNRHLAHIIRPADEGCMAHVWKSPAGDVDLRFIMQDYVRHLRHHVAQILG